MYQYEFCINVSALIPVEVVTDTVRVKVGELNCWDSEPLPFVKVETLGNRCTEQTVTEFYSQTDGSEEETLRFVGYLVEGRLDGLYETHNMDGQFDGRNSVSLDAM